MFRPHEQLHPRVLALLIEEFKEVGFPIADGDHLRVRDGLGHAHGLAKSRDPDEGVLLLDRDLIDRALVLGRLRLRRLALRVEDAQRQPRWADREDGMQMQAATLGPRLIGANDAQAVAFGQRRVVQVRAVLHAQDRPLRLHAPHRTLAMRREDRRHVDGLGIGMIDQPVVAFDCRRVAGGHMRKGLSRVFRFHANALHEPTREPRIAQPRGAKLVRGPLGAVDTLGRRQGTGTAAWRHADFATEVRIERIEIDVLDAFGRPPLPILRPRPAVCPTQVQLLARYTVPRTSARSAKLSTSHGAKP